jgi:phosphate transport system substrate-binding protein
LKRHWDWILAVLIIVLVGFIWFAQVKAHSSPAAPSQQLTGAGSTFFYPIESVWADAYHKTHPNLTINYQSIGSGAGIQQLKVQTIDFGASDAPMTDAQCASMPGRVLQIPMIAGAVVLAYNLPGVSTGVKLTSDIVADIFQGKISNWNDGRLRVLNPTLPASSKPWLGEPLVVCHRSDGSGTTYIFTQYLSAVSTDWKHKVGFEKSVNWPVGLGGKGNEGVASLIRQTPGAIGYVELAYAVENHLTYAALCNRSGNYVLPSSESTTAAITGMTQALKQDIRTSIVNSSAKHGYPIVGFTYALLYKDMPDRSKAFELADFLRWCLNDGQRIAGKLAYASLPSSVVHLNLAALDQMRSQGKRVARVAFN